MANHTRLTFRECTEISDLCPVESTVLSYYPNFGANIFFAVAFGLCTIGAVSLGTWKRTWTFMVAVGGGCLLETVGYIGRTLMHSNPWDKNAFQMQICCIILAPTLICAGIYLTLKHVTLNLNPSISRIKPRLYPLIFLPADASCLVVQAIGGGIAAAAGRTNRTLINAGNRAIIAGVALQVVVLFGFGIVGLDYWIRVSKWVRSGQAGPNSLALWKSRKFRLFGYAVAASYTAILIRCVYRVAEMAGGWGNHIMQDEISFMILDSTLVLVSVSLLTIFHPGLYFPQMAGKPAAIDEEKSVPTTSEGVKVESVSANEST